MDEVVVRAHAKVNLCLAVAAPERAGPRRGFHRLASVMACLDLADEVRVRPVAGDRARGEGGLSLRVTVSADAPRGFAVDWPAERDLSYRAARALSERIGRPLPAEIEVVKGVPPGGGLGGGSSDAAAVLVGLNHAFGLGLGAPLLRDVAAGLGSDVPFFVDEACVDGRRGSPRAAVVTGYGEVIERLDVPGDEAAPLVLLLPGFGCSTAAVYGAFDAALEAGGERHVFREPAVRRVADRLAAGARLAAIWGDLFNDLAGPARAVEPRLGDVLGSVPGAILSGSGSTVFTLARPDGPGLTGERDHADVAERAARLLL